jgi:prevent-host-death family protein
MTNVTFTEFRSNASQLLDRVERGETIGITRHGRVIARIVPADTTPATPSWKRPRERLVIEGRSVAEMIVEERRERDERVS